MVLATGLLNFFHPLQAIMSRLSPHLNEDLLGIILVILLPFIFYGLIGLGVFMIGQGLFHLVYGVPVAPRVDEVNHKDRAHLYY